MIFLLTIFRFLSISDLGRGARVCIRWKRIAEDPNLWRYMGLTYYGDFLSEEEIRESPRQKVIFHALSVIVNVSESLEDIERLVRCYQLDLYISLFRKYTRSITNIIMDTIFLSHKDLYYEVIAQGNNEIIEKVIQNLYAEKGRSSIEISYERAKKLNDILVERGAPKAIERKIESLASDHIKVEVFRDYGHITPQYAYLPLYGYQKNPQEARRLNDFLIEKGNVEAIERKIEGLCKGKYGYKINPVAARKFNDSLVDQGDVYAIKRKIEGLLKGNYGYERNPVAAREFNELLVRDRDPSAIARKIAGLALGIYGYNKTLSPSVDLLDSLIEKEDSWAVETKFACLYQGEWGYEKKQPAAIAFLEKEIGRGNQKAIITKIVGLAEGKYGYERNPVAAREFNDSLVDQGDVYAIKRKIEGLLKGNYGYERDPLAAIRFNDSLADNGNSGAIERKIEGLLKGNYGYEKDPLAVREYIERLVFCEFPIARAIGKYIKAFAMKYGVSNLGYELDRKKAFEFIKENHVPY